MLPEGINSLNIPFKCTKVITCLVKKNPIQNQMCFLQTMNMQMVHFPREHKTCAQHFSASVKSEHPTHVRQKLGKKSHSYVQGLNSDLEKTFTIQWPAPQLHSYGNI